MICDNNLDFNFLIIRKRRRADQTRQETTDQTTPRLENLEKGGGWNESLTSSTTPVLVPERRTAGTVGRYASTPKSSCAAAKRRARAMHQVSHGPIVENH